MESIVILGSMGLIGRRLIEKLSGKNHHVLACDIIDSERISELNCNATYLKVDLNNNNDVEILINNIKNNKYIIKGVVNCSYPRGKSYGKDFLDLDLDEFNETNVLHIGAYFNLMKTFCKYVMESNADISFVNIASVYGSVPPKFELYNNTKMVNPIEYSSVKASIIHMTKYVAKYMKGYKFRVNCISPGGILDGQDELFLENYKKYCLSKGMLEVDDLIGAVRFLLSDESRFINGFNLIVDDGFHL